MCLVDLCVFGIVRRSVWLNDRRIDRHAFAGVMIYFYCAYISMAAEDIANTLAQGIVSFRLKKIA